MLPAAFLTSPFNLRGEFFARIRSRWFAAAGTDDPTLTVICRNAIFTICAGDDRLLKVVNLAAAFAADDLFAGRIGKRIATALFRADDIALFAFCAMVAHWHSLLRRGEMHQTEEQEWHGQRNT